MTTAGFDVSPDAADPVSPPDEHAGELESPARGQFTALGAGLPFGAGIPVPAGVDLYENNAWFADATVSFMILKAWEYRADSRFAARFPLVKSSGRLRGAYLFGHPATDAGAQAASFCQVLRDCGFGPGDTAWLDFEVSDGKSPSWCSKWAGECCAAIDGGLGLPHGTTGVYTFTDFIWTGHCSGLGTRPLWFARPSVLGQVPQVNLGPWTAPVLVQYQVTSIDWDYFNGDAAGLEAFWGATAPVTSWTETLVNELPTLSAGSSGEDVRTLQGLLVARGRYVSVDGAFGPATKAAVTAFQSGAGLAADGIAGKDTWTALLRR